MTSVSHSIIVAEDEFLIRLLAAEALSSAGYRVIEVEHADAAVALLEATASEIHGLFTDIHMPGSMNGLELAHHARLHWPWLALLVTSGAAHPSATELPHRCRFLPKPYQAAHVVHHLRDILAA